MSKKPQKRKQPVRHERKRNRGFGLGYALLCSLAVAALIIGGVSVFFRVERFEVTGNERYSRGEILSALGIGKGDNLYTFNKFAVQDRMTRELPYLYSVHITRDLPQTLCVEVRESVPAAAVETGDGYLLLDADCKVLDRADKPGQAPVVTGMEITRDTPGKTAVSASPEQMNTLKLILFQLDSRGLSDTFTRIDLSGAFYVEGVWQDRVFVKLGLADGETEIRARALGQILSKLEEGDTGILDMSGKEYRFVPGDISEYLTTEPAVTPTPEPSPAPEADPSMEN